MASAGDDETFQSNDYSNTVGCPNKCTCSRRACMAWLFACSLAIFIIGRVSFAVETSPEPAYLRSSPSPDSIAAPIPQEFAAPIPQEFARLFNKGFAQYGEESGTKQEWMLGMYSANWLSYPFTLQDFERSYLPGKHPAQACEFERIVKRLDAGEALTLGVYGGSITHGNGCASQLWGSFVPCAWPSRLLAMLHTAYPHWNLTLKNFAQPAWGTRQFLSFVPEPNKADLYVLDFGLNDSPGFATDAFVRKLRGPKLFVNVFAACGQNEHMCKSQVPAHFLSPDCQLPDCDPRYKEIIQIPNVDGRPRLASPEAGNVALGLTTTPFFFHTVQQMDAYKARGYAFADYRFMVWPDKFNPRPDFGTIHNGMVHPDTVGHDFIAHCVLYAFTHEVAAARKRLGKNSGQPCNIEEEFDAEVEKACTRQDVFDATQPNTTKLPTKSVGWRLFEDKPNKPGWIAEEFGEDSLLEFNLHISQSFTVGFMKTYANASVVQMYVDSCDTVVDLDPIWQQRSTTTAALTFTTFDTGKPDHIAMPCLASQVAWNTRKIVLKARLGKFKLVTLYSC